MRTSPIKGSTETGSCSPKPSSWVNTPSKYSARSTSENTELRRIDIDSNKI